jgi:hypothetical protein
VTQLSIIERRFFTGRKISIFIAARRHLATLFEVIATAVGTTTIKPGVTARSEAAERLGNR